MNTKNKSFINIRPGLSSSAGRIALIFFVLIVTTDFGYIARAQQRSSEGWTRRAVTPTGRFTVSHKIAGWRKSPLGLLYYPVYFLSGIAIHGNPLVPLYPASHGCIRIPMFAAKEFSEMMPVGTTVIVHDGNAIEP